MAGSLISNGQRRRATSDATDLIELTEPWTKSSRTLEIETISRLREKSRWKKRSSSKHQDLSKWTSLLSWRERKTSKLPSKSELIGPLPLSRVPDSPTADQDKMNYLILKVKKN